MTDSKDLLAYSILNRSTPKRVLSEEELKRLAKGFAKNTSGIEPQDRGGVSKDVWPKMITATANMLEKRSKERRK